MDQSLEKCELLFLTENIHGDQFEVFMSIIQMKCALDQWLKRMRQSVEHFFVTGGKIGSEWANQFNEYSNGQLHYDQATHRITKND